MCLASGNFLVPEITCSPCKSSAMFLSTSGKTNAILCFATLYVCRNGEVLYPQRSEPWE